MTPSKSRSRIVRLSDAEIVEAIEEVDWAAIDALSDAQISRGVEADPDAPPIRRDLKARLAEGRARVVMPPMDVAAIRAKMGLSQERFARAVQISPHTLRNWEQGRREPPEGPARALLMAIDRSAETVMALLRMGS